MAEADTALVGQVGGAGEGFVARVGLFRAPTLTAAHKVIGVASILGHCFVVTHIITIAVTLAIAGFTWPILSFMLDIAGFLAGALFAHESKHVSDTVIGSMNSSKDGGFLDMIDLGDVGKFKWIIYFFECPVSEANFVNDAGIGRNQVQVVFSP